MTSELDPRQTGDAAPGDDRLADAARRAHATSLERLSPRVQAQLAQRRRAALSPRVTGARRWPWLAVAGAATLAIVIGVVAVRDGIDNAPPSRVATGQPTAPAPVVATAPAGTAPSPRIAPAATPVPPGQDDAAIATTAAADPAPDGLPEGLPDDLPDNLIAAVFDADPDADIGIDDGALDESPDFYEWLGSEDAPSDATESL